MSVPNLLAALRLVLAPVVMALVLSGSDEPTTRAATAAVFVVAALTDLVDGYLARRWRIATTVGAFLDTVADKVLVAGVLVALVEVGTTSTWVAFLIVGRELAVMGLRSVAALDQTRVPPSIWGKSKATVQFVAITLAIVRFDGDLAGWRLDQWAMAVAVAVTLLSAGDYFARFRTVFERR